MTNHQQQVNLRIDPSVEKLIELKDLPKEIAQNKKGRKLSIPSVYRWVREGIVGIRLETYWDIGKQCTTMEALDRFSQQVSEEKERRRAVGASANTPQKPAKLSKAKSTVAHARALKKLETK